METRFSMGAGFREAAHERARAGFVVLVMDPLSRLGGSASFPSPEASRKALAALQPAQRSADLESARAFLHSHASVRRDPIRIAD
jgi:dienelactone hydrolase